jgi:hypothetical protein
MITDEHKTLVPRALVAVSVLAALQLDRSRVQAEAERLLCDQLSLTITKVVQGCCFERDRNASLASQSRKQAEIPGRKGGSQYLSTRRFSADRFCVGYNNWLLYPTFSAAQERVIIDYVEHLCLDCLRPWLSLCMRCLLKFEMTRKEQKSNATRSLKDEAAHITVCTGKARRCPTASRCKRSS